MSDRSGELVRPPEERAAMWRRVARGYVQQLASPPPGWFTFGTHVDQPDVALEFWGSDDGGMPIWERPANHVPCDHERAVTEIARATVLDRGTACDMLAALSALATVSARRVEAAARVLSRRAGWADDWSQGHRDQAVADVRAVLTALGVPYEY